MEKDNIEKIKSIKDIKDILINVFPIFFRNKKQVGIFSMCFYRISKNNKSKAFKRYIKLNNDYFEVKMILKNGLGGVTLGNYIYYFNIYKVKFDLDKVSRYSPQNLIKVVFKDKNKEIIIPVVYNLLHFTRYKGITSRIFKINDDLVCYFRQTKLNSIALTVRNPNITDKFINKFKILMAKIVSMLTLSKDIILLYEKEANKYEESASMVYERLIDLGYDNSYFVIRKNSKHVDFIDEKYRKNIIWAFTFKHYLYFFKCHKFIGTESVPHVIELRTANRFITKRYIKKNYKQVFLQHGVMYMIALDANTRSGFRKNGNEMPMDAKIVVSSKKEAEHFTKLGGFSEEDMYITGLPFYDRTIRKKDADKIVIMLTWRTWDYNLLVSNYKEASYYKFIKKIIENIPSQYYDKLYLLPHPLVLSKFKNIDLNKWIPDIKSYDKILEETDLLITDYSSIAYSAFYRGSNVIFCWDELDKCMKKYKSHLMLNSKNVFGDVTYNCKNLGELIKDNYKKSQKELYVKRYKEIVEFSDNKNTDRLIECLKRDNII